MQLCPQCGWINRPGARFCSKCRARFPAVAATGPTRLRPGQVMHGQYTEVRGFAIVRPLGKGGMGALYLATQTIANQPRDVVVKEMLDYFDPADPQGEARARQRFEAEAATLARLNCAGIPQIFDYFSEGGRNYIVMQFIQGRNLEAGLTHTDEDGHGVPGRPYPADQVRRWGMQVCRILENLAAQNVVHMDIKPANLILDHAGDVWLVDFGTARAQRVVQAGGVVGMQKSSVYGTAGYAPPEQYQRRAEPRSDVYALAATLYHLLTDDDPRGHPFQFPHLDRLPTDLASALKQALAQDVWQRLTAAQLRRLLDPGPATGPLFWRSHALRWQDGTISPQPADLVQAADRRWDEARGYFTGGQWERWFAALHRNDIVAQVAQAKRQSQNPDVALDTFLRALDPAFPSPRLQVSTAMLDAGAVPWQTQRALDLEIRNAGGGCLHGRVTNLPAWAQVSPADFAAHDRQTLKVTVDAGLLTPRAQPHRAPFVVDAGTGGQATVLLAVSVPEPQLVLSANALDLGAAYRGEALQGTFAVSNPGGSAFDAEARCDAAWMHIRPARLRCEPGRSSQVMVEADTERMTLGRHTAQLRVRAAAGSWGQSQDVPVVVVLRWFKTFRQRWAPTLDWAAVGVAMASAWFGLTGALTGNWFPEFATGKQFSDPVLASLIAGGLVLASIVLLIAGGWLGVALDRRASAVGGPAWWQPDRWIWVDWLSEEWDWVRLLPWVRDAWAAPVSASFVAAVSAGLGLTADLWLGLAPSLALAMLVGSILWGALHRPGRTTAGWWSGIFAVVIFLLALIAVAYLAVRPGVR